MTDKHSMKS